MTAWKPIPKDLPPHGEYGPPPFDGKIILLRSSQGEGQDDTTSVIVGVYFPFGTTPDWATAKDWTDPLNDYEEWTEIPA